MPAWAACMELSEVKEALERRRRLSWATFGTGVGLVSAGLAVQFLPVGGCYEAEGEFCEAYGRLFTSFGLYALGTTTAATGAVALLFNWSNRRDLRVASKRIGLSYGRGGAVLRF